MVQQLEQNRGRPEARCLIRFDATAERACFPGAQQAARLARYIDRAQPKDESIETDWLVSSHFQAMPSAEAMYLTDRHYWGIENRLHLRLDVTFGEDRSRARLPVAAPNLAMIRRAILSLAAHARPRGKASTISWPPVTREKPSSSYLPPNLMVTAMRSQR